MRSFRDQQRLLAGPPAPGVFLRPPPAQHWKGRRSLCVLNAIPFSGIGVGFLQLQVEAAPQQHRSICFSLFSACSGAGALVGTVVCSFLVRFWNRTGTFSPPWDCAVYSCWARCACACPPHRSCASPHEGATQIERTAPAARPVETNSFLSKVT
jgi:hypothetical protein